MRRKRARTIFWLLVAGSAAMATAGPRLGRLQAAGGALVAPVSWPAFRLSGLVEGRFAGSTPADMASPGAPRASAEVLEENERLRLQVGWLREQLDVYRRIHADRAALGDTLLPRCAAATVVGVERNTLQLVNATLAEIEPGDAVLHYGRAQVGIAGVISAAGPGGAQARLITDPAVRVEARFIRLHPDRGPGDAAVETIPTDPPLVEGAGGDVCHVARMNKQQLDASGLKPGDWAVLADPAWDAQLHGLPLGRVETIEPIPDEAGFARIVIRPAADLRALKEVMVLVK